MQMENFPSGMRVDVILGLGVWNCYHLHFHFHSIAISPEGGGSPGFEAAFDVYRVCFPKWMRSNIG